MHKLDKDKYDQILKSSGLSAAITALHHEKDRLEFETFEGPKGYQREIWNFLQEIRDFSVELWNKGTQNSK